MILIADSGSTKTDWVLVAQQQRQTLHTQGLSPVHQSADEMRHVLSNELLPHLSLRGAGQASCQSVESVYFYGSGVLPELSPVVTGLLRSLFPSATTVEAQSDLLGACRALCGRREGIAAILGTGSASCLYDGSRILQQTPSLGYILGDEGSGAVLGRMLVHHIYKGRLSEKIRIAFEQETGYSVADIIQRVYRQPLANRFLASLTPFLHAHLADESLRAMVIESFQSFFFDNVVAYQRPDLPIDFVGSIAWHFQCELREAASRCHLSVGTILQHPVDGLVEYHCGK